MILEKLNGAQRAALIDFAVLGMYADGHLALQENKALENLLKTMGLTDEIERERALETSITRVRGCMGNKEKSADHLQNAAQVFAGAGNRELVSKWISEVMESDEKVTPEEANFLKRVLELFPS